jgi:hypothetical protein
MQLLTIQKHKCPEAAAAFSRAKFLFDCAENAQRSGFAELVEPMTEAARAWFQASRDLESRLRVRANGNPLA